MMNLKPWENYVYQPLSTASIRLIRENQKFLDFALFGTAVKARRYLKGIQSVIQKMPATESDIIAARHALPLHLAKR
ncbi:MAG: hypothetical protein JNK27_02350 [Chitinophagaceae bacterium]|nr:hypothetical protein [Chitinophagaceae bacterium]